MTRPRILVLADVPTWAWGRKATAYQRHLSDRFHVEVAFHANVPAFSDFDLVHLFEVSQVGTLTAYGPLGQRAFKAVAGLTANVWRTWGAPQMQQWAGTVDALHGNSLLITADLKQFHPRVYYTPNGVDPQIYRQAVPREGPVVFGHVGKPNPRKGGVLIVEAARAAGVELRLIQRTSKLALTEPEMVAWYQGIDVMVTASNMDGTPNPMLEGAACACALLSTPIGNMPEFIVPGGNGNGYLTEATLPYPAMEPGLDAADIEARQHALRDELHMDMRWFAAHPLLTRAMGQRARQTVLDGWTWAQQVAHVGRMWEEVLG